MIYHDVNLLIREAPEDVLSRTDERNLLAAGAATMIQAERCAWTGKRLSHDTAVALVNSECGCAMAVHREVPLPDLPDACPGGEGLPVTGPVAVQQFARHGFAVVDVALQMSLLRLAREIHTFEKGTS